MILSIESSCDDSSLALTRIADAKLVYHIKLSQDQEHSRYGGVVPEIASRLHAERLPEILSKLKIFLNNDFSCLKAIAVTSRPGLSVTLIEGMMMAKTLALALHLPLICINHLRGHIYSLFINNPTPIFPLGILLVSGGHTQILQAHSQTRIAIIAQSLDDSFGESFDKVAKNLHLGYPGGPIVQEMAQNFTKTHRTPHQFPVPLAQSKQLAFSFSGLKNAVRLAIIEDSKDSPLQQENLESICAGFEQSACAHILQRCKMYFQTPSAQEIKFFAIVGGASANLRLRQEIESLCQQYDKKLLLAPLEFCSDNAAMIGRAAIEDYKCKNFTPLSEARVAPKSLSGDFV